MMNYYKHPRLFSVDVDKENKVFVDALSSQWEVLDSLQTKILEAFSNGCDIKTAASRAETPLKYTEQVVDLLYTLGFVSTSPKFSPVIFSQPPLDMSIWVQTSNLCNLNCRYCYIQKNKNYMSNSVWEQFSKKIIQTIKDRELKRVTLRLGGGEPILTLKSYACYLQVLKKKIEEIGCDFGVVLITNITLLTPEILRLIRDLDCRVSISLDGLGGFHDQNRMFKNGRGSFNVISRNMDILINEGIAPMTLTVISRKNLQGLPEFTSYILEKNLFFRYNLVIGDGISLIQDELIRTLKHCYRIVENYMANHPSYDFSQKHAFCNLMTNGPVFQGCNAGFGALTVNTDGKIYVCQTVLKEGKSCGSIWNKQDLLTLSMGQKEYPLWVDRPACNPCHLRYICAGGCPLHEHNGDRSMMCKTFQEITPIIFKLKGKQRLANLFGTN
jgi:uncharacterized protein